MLQQILDFHSTVGKFFFATFQSLCPVIQYSWQIFFTTFQSLCPVIKGLGAHHLVNEDKEKSTSINFTAL